MWQSAERGSYRGAGCVRSKENWKFDTGQQNEKSKKAKQCSLNTNIQSKTHRTHNLYQPDKRKFKD